MSENKFCVIMAGGSGQRFWPASRNALPKQLLSIEEGVTLVQATLARVPAEIGPERTLVVTNAAQVEGLKAQVDLPAENIIAEPVGRDTAPCIGLAARLISKRCPDAVMAVMAADHVIKPSSAFQSDLARAMDFAAENEAIVTIGIPPTHPATGYGYIKLGEEAAAGVRRVDRFTEKPAADVAAGFLEAGGYLWNSGIFVWPCSRILDEISAHIPDLARGLEDLAPAMDSPEFAVRMAEVFPLLPKISVDHGVLEHADEVYCVEATFAWDDVGSLAALARHNPQDEAGNTRLGDVTILDASECIADNRGHGVVALLGVEGLIVVNTPDAVLVARRGDEERVKELVQKLRDEGKEGCL